MQARNGDHEDDGALLTDEQVADNVIGVLFAAQDTTASVLTWIVKYLHDHPKLLDAVRAEQAAIREANDGGRRPLTWAQTRSMTLTHRVRALARDAIFSPSDDLARCYLLAWLLMAPSAR
jgi:cytochrome P450